MTVVLLMSVCDHNSPKQMLILIMTSSFIHSVLSSNNQCNNPPRGQNNVIDDENLTIMSIRIFGLVPVPRHGSAAALDTLGSPGQEQPHRPGAGGHN